MSTLIPSASACHTVQMPPIEKDDRLNLNVRTGSASTLHHSFVFTYGGLTIGLELDDRISIRDIETTFAAKVSSNKSKQLDKYLSGEIFYLDLISKAWSRVVIPPNAAKPRPRLFHELATGNNCLYLFGGLVLSESSNGDDSAKLMSCNDLWEFNLLKKSWILLNDGSGWQNDPRIPSPRFSHKMTTISSLSFANKRDHSGLMIAGGHDQNSVPLYDNCVFNVVDNTYVDCGPPLSFPSTMVNGTLVSAFKTSNPERFINVNYLNSVIVNFREDFEYSRKDIGLAPGSEKLASKIEESLFIYAPTHPSENNEVANPLLSAKIGKTIKQPKLSLLHRKRNLRSRSATDNLLRRTVPHNLRYPTGGVFGQNLVIIGFLPNDYDISIFIYNKPTGKWSRLNIFCHHDYGSHRFWGGFAWTSHHKVVLLGNYVTSHTTSSVRYFSSLITVSLPVTNLLASMELAGPRRALSNIKKSDTETSSVSDIDTAASSDEVSTSSLSQASEPDEDIGKAPLRRFSNQSNKSESQQSSTQNAATFNDYVHYAAPKVKFTKVRSVFPPAAITLGRNAFDRYGNVISDFELISLNGDRIPVCISILMARWGKYFIDLLAKAYVKAVDQFEHNQFNVESQQVSRSSKNSGSSSGSRGKSNRLSSNEFLTSFAGDRKDIGSAFGSPRPTHKEAPQFRLPFQDKNFSQTSISKDIGSVDPHNQQPDRRNSSASNLSGSSIINSHLKEIPAQLPLPHEPIPDVPATPISYRSSSRKNSADVLSPRASLLHTLSVLRSIPSRSPKSSPRQSPRGSISLRNLSMEDLSCSSEESRLKPESRDKLGASAFPMTASSSVSPRAMSMDLGKLAQNSNISSDESSKDLSASGGHSESSESQHNYKSLLDFPETNWESYAMEPSLIPRKLYVPFSTDSLKAFAEYLYTGQVGNKWSFRPCALDCLWMARYYKVQLLYDLLCEVLYGIIGRKEATVIHEGKKLRKKFDELFAKSKTPIKNSFKFPLDEYEGFLDTVDDGYMDIALLRKSSNVHKSSTSSRSGKRGSSFSLTRVQELSTSSTSREGVEPTNKSEDGVVKANSTDESTSASDEDAPPLHFLDYEKKNSLPSIRYKSVFDKSIYDTMNPNSCSTEQEIEDEKKNLVGVTLENLVSMDSPEPSDCVIELIHEVASICADVKLMLRSMNARQMSLALAQTRKEYLALEKRLEEEESEIVQTKPDASLTNGREDYETTESSNCVAEQDSKPTLVSKNSSAGSVATLKTLLLPQKQREECTAHEKTDKDALRPGVSGSVSNPTLTSVKEQPFSFDSNRKFDKQIAQRIRQDEKTMSRALKEEKARKHTTERDGKKRSDTFSSIRPAVSPASSFSLKDALSGHKHVGDVSKAHTFDVSKETTPLPEKTRHGLFGRLGRGLKHSKSEEGRASQKFPGLTRTDSSTSVLSSSSKKSNQSKMSGHSVGGLFGLRKK